MNGVLRLGLLLLLSATAMASEGASGAERNVAYGPSTAHRMDVYLPAQAHKAPIILMVHGGGWAIGDKSNARVVTNKSSHWNQRGFIFLSINNRLLPAANPLEQAQDVAKALAVVQRHAESWGGDPSRVVLMGHSAGAHLVDLLASDPSIAQQQGAKPWLGTVSLDTAVLDVSETMNRRHPRLYDNAFGKDPAFWTKVSPMERLTAAPQPMLLVCSSSRQDHPCAQAEKFASKVKSLGGKATVLPVNLSHREINENLGLDGEYTASVDEFLGSLGLR